MVEDCQLRGFVAELDRLKLNLGDTIQELLIRAISPRLAIHGA